MPRGFLTLVHLAPEIADLGVGGGATEASGGHGFYNTPVVATPDEWEGRPFRPPGCTG